LTNGACRVTRVKNKWSSHESAQDWIVTVTDKQKICDVYCVTVKKS
jgi:hypothetical protein